MRSVGLQQNPDKPSWRLVETAALSPRRTAVPKSRGRKKKLPHGVVPITPRVYEALLEQRKAFVDKFGREPGVQPLGIHRSGYIFVRVKEHGVIGTRIWGRRFVRRGLTLRRLRPS
jgi:hypothetical protein